MNKLKFIREKCIEANPEIVELKFGCEVESNLGVLLFIYDEGLRHDGGIHLNTVEGYYCLYDDVEGRMVDPTLINRKSIKIIGRPIRLADVLLAMRKNKDCTDSDQAWLIEDCNREYIWNLKNNDLDSQSEETIEFIYNLLK